MSFVHSLSTALYVNGVDLTTYINKDSMATTIDKAETTTLPDGAPAAKTYIPGFMESTMTVSGYFDGSSATALGQEISVLLGTASSVFTVLPQGAGVGNSFAGLSGFETDYSVPAEEASAVQVSLTVQSSGVPTRNGYDAWGKTTQTTTGTSAAQNNGASSSNGLSSFLHVFAMSGSASPTAVVIVQHSPDNSTWTTLATHATISAVPGFDYQYVAPGVTINQYLRSKITITGTTPSFTFWHGFSRF